LRLFSFGGYGLALAALALVVFGAIECPPEKMGVTKIFATDGNSSCKCDIAYISSVAEQLVATGLVIFTMALYVHT